MNKFKALSVALCTMLGGYAAHAGEDTTGKLAIEFHTTIYETYGSTNAFSLVFGANAAGVGEYIDIDCGFGTEEHQLVSADYDTDNEESTGTIVTCNVSSEGIVKVYCDDPSWIDWFDATGCYIDKITFSDELSNLVYLSLSHNELTSLDLSKMKNIQTLYVTDNTFSDSPLVIGEKPYLTILEMNNIGAISSDFDICNYPNLWTFDAWNAQGLTHLTPSGCPELVKLSIDGTDVAELDVTQNPLLQVLNITDTRITEIDLSKNPKLTQLYCTHESTVNSEYKLKSLDVSNNPYLYYLFCTGNDFTELDVTNNPALYMLTARKNLLTTLDVSKNTNLYGLNISDNYIGYANLPWPKVGLSDSSDDMYGEYDYAQREFVVDKSYAVGTVLDFSDLMLREHTDTEAVLYAINEEDSTNPIQLSSEYYDYDVATAKLTLKEVYADSVYVSFSNSIFSDANLRTRLFKIKSAADFGKPTEVATFTTAATKSSGKEVSFNIGIQGATPENPKKFYVNFGDGTYTECVATTGDATENNVKGAPTGNGYLTIAVDDDVEISALAIDGLSIYSTNLAELHSLRELSLTNCQLYSIDLQWNRCLQNINLSHNNLSSFTLVANNQGYGKNALTDVNISYNNISTFEWNENYTVKRFNAAHNKLSSLTLTNNATIEGIDISYNNFSEFTCADCDALTDLNVEGNSLSEITLPDENIISKLNVSNNNFTLATLPEHTSLLTEENYTYAPQARYTIATKAPGLNLASQNIDDATTYTWKYEETGERYNPLYLSIQATGQFVFRHFGDKVYCEMTNTEFPDFTGDNALRTTAIETADMPSNLVMQFTVAAATEDDDTDINSDVYLTLQSASTTTNNALYIDWQGNGNLAQYEFTSSNYTTFYPTVTEGATVSIYSYDEDDDVFVFSLRNVKMSSFKLGSEKSLSKVYCLNLTNAGLEEIDFPKSSVMNEVIIPGNKLSSFDFDLYPTATYINLSNNNLSNADLSHVGNVLQLFLGGNGLKEVNFGENSRLWNLYLNDNELTTLDLSNLKGLSQVAVNGNKLTDINVSNNTNINVLYANDNELEHIDVSALKNLTVLEISGNKFKFSTLPLESEIFAGKSIYTYEYSSQAELPIETENGIVDLSSEAVINGTATTYVWCIGEPDFSDSYLVNETLYGPDDNVDDDPDYEPEYTIENGVTKFIADYSTYSQALACVLTNDLFPNLTLQTSMIRPTSYSGVEDIVVDGSNMSVKVVGTTVYVYADQAKTASIYGINGALVASANVVNGVATFNNVAQGMYLVKAADKATKIVVR